MNIELPVESKVSLPFVRTVLHQNIHLLEKLLRKQISPYSREILAFCLKTNYIYSAVMLGYTGRKMLLSVCYVYIYGKYKILTLCTDLRQWQNK